MRARTCVQVGIDFKESDTYAAAGDQSAVGVVASGAALRRFYCAADGIDNYDSTAAVVRALECVLKQVQAPLCARAMNVRDEISRLGAG